MHDVEKVRRHDGLVFLLLKELRRIKRNQLLMESK